MIVQAYGLLFDDSRVESIIAEATKSNKLNNTNYAYWKACIKFYLIRKDLWEIMNGTNMIKLPETPDNTETRKMWETKAISIILILLMNVDKDTYQHI